MSSIILHTFLFFDSEASMLILFHPRVYYFFFIMIFEEKKFRKKI